MPLKSDFDAVVVGSGASGGWACKRLTEAGLKVALVDAGRPQKDSNFTEHMPPFQLKYRDSAPEVVRRTRPRQQECYACTEYNYDWFCNDLDEPYTTAPGLPFSWQGRMRVLGGRTNVWGRQSYRLSDLDFKAASHDGYGEDWPLSYKDLAPYYDLVEEYVGITGIREGVYELPDGKFLPPMGMTCAETQFRNRVQQKLRRTVTLGRSANLTKPINGRAACHYCGPCERGCVTHSYFNSAFTTVADALNTGRCTYIPNAMVHKVVMDDAANVAKGVMYVDRNTHEVKEVYGRTVLVCAQALESARILLNSGTTRYPNGLANSSGVLGHYLMDHTFFAGGATGEFPDLPEKANLNGPNRPNSIYIIRFRNTHNGPRSKKFLRGYGYEGHGEPSFNLQAPGFGEAYKKAAGETFHKFNIGAFGECLARFENHVAIDPNVVDSFGIPILRIRFSWGENEREMVKDMGASAAEMVEIAGATNVKHWAKLPVPGFSIHETGVARMGNDAKKSVLNQFQQSHDISNLFVLDASCFVSSACQNPTLTIMALCVRSCDHLMEEMKRGNL
jgi:choline dehydrogenase-like flavoprotein